MHTKNRMLTSMAHWGAFRAEVSGNNILQILPFTGDSCPSPILSAMVQAICAPNRVARPSVRASWLRYGPGQHTDKRGLEPFVEISWQQAIHLVSQELLRTRDEHGNNAIFAGSYGWASAGAFHHPKTHLHRCLAPFGGWTGQVNNYSYGAAMALLPHVLGGLEAVSGPLTDWGSIAADTGLFVAFGGLRLSNSQVVSGGGVNRSTLPYLRKALAAGTRFVGISPLADDMPAELNAQWIAIKPGTDTALMLALCQQLLVDGRADLAFLARYTVGFDRLLPSLSGKTPRWAEAITGVPAAIIRALARDMVSHRTMLSASWSLQRADHGEQSYWALIALAAMVGQIGLPGGGFGFGYGSMGGMGNPRQAMPVPRIPAQQNPTQLDIPVARVADLLLKPGQTLAYNGRNITLPDIHMVYWAGGNPFHHHQDLNRLRSALHRPETIVVHEPWWTPMAKFADIVLPATTPWEREDIGASSKDRYIIRMDKLVGPIGSARNDFDIFSDIADALGHGEVFTQKRDTSGWLAHLYNNARSDAAKMGIEIPGYEAFSETGHVAIPCPERSHILFESFRYDPDAHPLRTPSGKIEIASEQVASFGYEECPGHPVWIEPREWANKATVGSDALHLLTNQPVSKLHGQFDFSSLSKSGKLKGREPLRMHPVDAQARGIGTADMVRVFNHRGSCISVAILDTGVMPGVVQMSTGAWYDPDSANPSAPLEKHGNPNVLTPDRGTSRLGQGCSAQSTLVQIERIANAPPVTAFELPEFVAGFSSAN
jgi:biotin/methionine sulfoxide reductase